MSLLLLLVTFTGLAVLWVLAGWGASGLALIILLASALLIWLVRPAKPAHYPAQWPLPLTALLAGLACAHWFWRLRGHYQQFIAQLDTSLPPLMASNFPHDLGWALLFGNAIFLLLWAVLNLLLVFVFSRCRFGDDLLGIAYEQELGPLGNWSLKPGWLTIRWIGWCAVGIGAASLLAVGLGQLGWIGALPWVGLLPAGLISVGFALATWLGGPLKQSWQAEFDGTDTQTSTDAEFGALWRRYHGHWPTLWRAAGNRSPTTED